MYRHTVSEIGDRSVSPRGDMILTMLRGGPAPCDEKNRVVRPTDRCIKGLIPTAKWKPWLSSSCPPRKVVTGSKGHTDASFKSWPLYHYIGGPDDLEKGERGRHHACHVGIAA